MNAIVERKVYHSSIMGKMMDYKNCKNIRHIIKTKEQKTNASNETQIPFIHNGKTVPQWCIGTL